MDMCVKCGVRPAVMYITKMENGKTSMEGYCLSCAKELGLAPIDQMFEKESARLVKGLMVVCYLGVFYYQMHFTWSYI